MEDVILVKYTDYLREKLDFFERHGDYSVAVTVRKDTRIKKLYEFEDGVSWCETHRPVTERVMQSFQGVKFVKEILMMRTEYSNSEDTEIESKFFYEPY